MSLPIKKPAFWGVFLLVLFFALDGFLFLKLRSLQKIKTGSEKNIFGIEMVNSLPGFNLKLNSQKTEELFRESGLLNDGNLTLNLDSLQEYSPDKIIISYQPFPSPEPTLIQAYHVEDQLSFGYNVDQSTGSYIINFYFNQAYLNGKASTESSYLLRSSLVKAVVYLGAVNQKKGTLSSADREELNNKLPDFLGKYEDVLEVL